MHFPKKSILILCMSWLTAGLYSQEIFLSTLSGELYSLDLSDCSYTLIGDMPLSTTDISFHPNGNLYAVTGSGRIYEIDVAAGTSSLEYIFEANPGQLYTALTISADGTFYACGLGGELWSYDLDSDTGQYLGDVGYGAEGDLTFFDGELYMAAEGDNIVLVDTENPSNSTVVVNDNVPGRIFGIVSYAESCEEVQTYALTDNAANIYQIDFETASLDLYCQIPLAVSGGASTFEFLGSDPVELLDISADGFSCQASDGTISIQASGGIGSLTYSLDGTNFQISPTFSNLPADEYIIYVQDEVGCLVDETVDLNLNVPVITDIETTFASCDEDNGSLTFSIEEGEPPFQTSIDGGPFGNETTFEGLAAGSYSIEVLGGNGCSATAVVNVGSFNTPAFANLEVSATTCGEDNGSISFSAEGGQQPYIFQLNGQEITNTELTNLPSGNYALQITDAAGCTIDEELVIAASSAIVIEEVMVVNSSCGLANGQVDLAVSGGEDPLSYELQGLAIRQTPQFENVPAGSYNLEVVDGNGCVETGSVQVDGSPALVMEAGAVEAANCNEPTGRFQFSATGGTGPIDLKLDGKPLFFTDALESLTAGAYTLVGEDVEGCTDTLLFGIPSGLCPIYLPNVFSPNDDGVNDLFGPLATSELGATINRFVIFDRWGGMVHSVSDLAFGDSSASWRGRKQGKPLDAGIYTYLLEVGYATGEVVQLAGDVMLVR